MTLQEARKKLEREVEKVSDLPDEKKKQLIDNLEHILIIHRIYNGVETEEDYMRLEELGGLTEEDIETLLDEPIF